MVFVMQPKQKLLLASLAVVSLVVAACAGNQTSNQGGTTGTANPAATTAPSNLSGSVLIDGSSTVFPISEAMAEEFQKVNPNVKVTVGSSGTGGGFKKFCAGETDITGASRPIKPSEVELCKKNNIEYVELPVAFDGLSVVVNPKNEFVKCLSIDELKTAWEPAAQGKIKTWNQIKSDFPNKPLALYGPGTDSGTYDYFTSVIVGEEGKSRGDYTASEDDNVLVQGVASDVNAMGFFGYAYYVQNKDKLKLVAIDGGKGCVDPSPETIQNGTYTPLSRPEFVYVNKKSLDRPEVEAMAKFYVAPENAKLVEEVGYVALPASFEEKIAARIAERKTGSVFQGKGSTKDVKLEDLL
ncbi:PstS family phosphate ABC transporter substrate-binding protein [Leptothermofonsia sp. ETS-13]|uniref:PstS family phosphate ABC transporter substrate-binding protein n=1 Tax=Leptothermofonsia sp. ETS-13 TaxID=3035696 RepID=UPI003B9EAC84